MKTAKGAVASGAPQTSSLPRAYHATPEPATYRPAPLLSAEEWVTVLRAQNERFLSGRVLARGFGHKLSEPWRGQDKTLHVSCTVCGLAHEEPLFMALTVPTLPCTYCPRRPWRDGDSQRFWYYPHEHHLDVEHCLCDSCEAGIPVEPEPWSVRPEPPRFPPRLFGSLHTDGRDQDVEYCRLVLHQQWDIDGVCQHDGSVVYYLAGDGDGCLRFAGQERYRDPHSPITVLDVAAIVRETAHELDVTVRERWQGGVA